MNFVSMRGSALDNKETFTMKKMTPEHWQLFGECIDHDLKVVPELISKWLNPVIPDLKNIEQTEKLRKRPHKRMDVCTKTA